MISACVEASPLGGISKAPKQDTLCVFTAVHLLNCVRHKHMRYVGVLPAMCWLPVLLTCPSWAGLSRTLTSAQRHSTASGDPAPWLQPPRLLLHTAGRLLRGLAATSMVVFAFADCGCSCVGSLLADCCRILLQPPRSVVLTDCVAALLRDLG